jgi:hypothetical protein
VGNPSRQGADGVHSLCLAQVRFEAFAFCNIGAEREATPAVSLDIQVGNKHEVEHAPAGL